MPIVEFHLLINSFYGFGEIEMFLGGNLLFARTVRTSERRSRRKFKIRLLFMTCPLQDMGDLL